tara:strand:- start:639 stop:1775 length:1137 start_codon:yes stop_codon:yes gene_type:complete
MAARFKLHAQPRLDFGLGSYSELPRFLSPFEKIVIVCGSQTILNSGRLKELSRQLPSSLIIPTRSSEPTLKDVDLLTTTLRSHDPDAIVAIGGGSTIDLAKASAVLVNNPNGDQVLAYLEGIGEGLTLKEPGIPLFAVPTTAGTGAEATINAVIASPEHGVKKSLRSSLLMPLHIVIDPELQMTCPKQITIDSGMDAITQCFESYISCRANEFTRPLALQGFKMGWKHIETAVDQPMNNEARSAMACCAYFSGVALANSGLGLAHGIAAALGVTAEISHGRACSILLPFAAKFNASHCRSAYSSLSNAIGMQPATDLPKQIERLSKRLGVSNNFSELGIGVQELPDLVERSYGNSMRGNPVLPTPDQLVSALTDYYYQ